MINTAFFSALRKRESGVFGTSLSQGQVDGCEALLAACAGYPLAHTAHVLAEVHHETGGGMLPVKETVFPYSKNRNPSDATVKARLDRAWGKGQLPWVSKPYWRNGWFGRGQIQLTHEANYRKMTPVVGVDLVRQPSKALDLPISAKIAAVGCSKGMFTGKRLSDFNGPPYDHHRARAIVNGDTRTVGPKIAAAAAEFEDALRAAKWDHGVPIGTSSGAGLWAAIINIIRSIFGGKK